jgi:hypothetical protein
VAHWVQLSEEVTQVSQAWSHAPQFLSFFPSSKNPGLQSHVGAVAFTLPVPVAHKIQVLASEQVIHFEGQTTQRLEEFS